MERKGATSGSQSLTDRQTDRHIRQHVESHLDRIRKSRQRRTATTAESGHENWGRFKLLLMWKTIVRQVEVFKNLLHTLKFNWNDIFFEADQRSFEFENRSRFGVKIEVDLNGLRSFSTNRGWKNRAPMKELTEYPFIWMSIRCSRWWCRWTKTPRRLSQSREQEHHRLWTMWTKIFLPWTSACDADQAEDSGACVDRVDVPGTDGVHCCHARTLGFGKPRNGTLTAVCTWARCKLFPRPLKSCAQTRYAGPSELQSSQASKLDRTSYPSCRPRRPTDVH